MTDKKKSRSSAAIACGRVSDMKGSELNELAGRLVNADRLAADRLRHSLSVALSQREESDGAGHDPDDE